MSQRCVHARGSREYLCDTRVLKRDRWGTAIFSVQHEVHAKRVVVGGWGKRLQLFWQMPQRRTNNCPAFYFYVFLFILGVWPAANTASGITILCMDKHCFSLRDNTKTQPNLPARVQFPLKLVNDTYCPIVDLSLAIVVVHEHLYFKTSQSLLLSLYYWGSLTFALHYITLHIDWFHIDFYWIAFWGAGFGSFAHSLYSFSPVVQQNSRGLLSLFVGG